MDLGNLRLQDVSICGMKTTDKSFNLNPFDRVLRSFMVESVVSAG